ncbi:MAG: NFACT RNA binding domain-containing protein [Candidatus Cloacimonadaceae bacterium]
MKYFMLAQWVKENSNQKALLERVYLSSAEAVFAFQNKASLAFHYKTSSPLLYFDTAAQNDAQKGQSIWSYLNKAELYDIEIADRDRILTFSFRQKDIYQKNIEYRLIFECMPPLGNLILCIAENSKLMIKDALHKYTYADNPQRQILSGLEYEPPRTDFSPQAEEVNYPLWVKPALEGEAVECNAMNDYFLQYYRLVASQKELQQQKQTLQSKWRKELAKAEKKLHQQQEELLVAEQMQTWLAYSEAIKSNLPLINKGDANLEAVDYYDPEMQIITIPLKQDKSAQENLNFYIKKYRKAKAGKAKILEQIVKTQAEIEHLKEILSYFDTDKWRDLSNDKTQAKDAVRQIRDSEHLLKLSVNGDWEILIGRKAKENDLITTQLAKPADWWFHTRIYHGSHILLRNFHKKEPPAELVELCCSLAAWFSKARHSENVPVDYTQIRFVRKPRKSAPGFVTYTNQKTVFANPVDVNAARELLLSYAG